jgi:hypothetical protein
MRTMCAYAIVTLEADRTQCTLKDADSVAG